MIKKIIKSIIPIKYIHFVIAVYYKLVHRIENFNFRIYEIYYNNKFKNNILRKNTTDSLVFRDIFINKELKLPIQIYPSVIIDAGAYIGLSSLYFAAKYPKAKIIAIEPAKENYLKLKENTFHQENIFLENNGLYFKDCLLKVENRGTGHWGFKSVEVQNGEYDIKAVTLESIIEKYNLKKIDILKIDIEGSEKPLFSQNYENWLGMVDVVIIELHDNIDPECSQVFNNAIQKYKWSRKLVNGEKVILIR